MTQIIKGGNLPLSGEPMRVAVVRRSGGAEAPKVDAAALLVDADGKVRDRGDLVFYNQPEHAGSGIRLLGEAQGEGGVVADWLEIDPGRIEASVERVVVAASCDGGTFGEVEDLYVRAVSAATGAQLALYAVEDATTETAILLGEFYRRNGGWKFRAVGQGYDSGLPALATDFGFSPSEEEGEEDEPGSDGGMAQDVTAPAPAAYAPAPAPAAYVPAPVAVEKAGAPVPYSGAPQPAALGRLNDLPREMGPEFAYFEYQGEGKEDVETGLTLPRGFLAVDVVKKGAGHLDIVTLTVRKRRWRQVMRSGMGDLRGVGVLHHDGQSPLRLRVDTRGRWMIRLRPVSTLRSFDGPVEGYGPDVLAYTGDETGVRFRFEGDEDKKGYFGVAAHRKGGHWEYRFSRRDRGRGKGDLPRGPRLLVVEADGAWSMEPRPGGSGGFWSRSGR
ncbi:TerD family protein [Streptomyces sp. TLI_105]|uniref:TerD family protein n=1 Tax=Streptomyces sp. TLI_105 TaxID=1881019 RepID=UPI00089D9417|nr:TerD family protein [Streptomyces sp. TLI_105]SEC82007.1 Stress response protein SCP2 [Streptomyces sp. TLI_105]